MLYQKFFKPVCLLILCTIVYNTGLKSQTWNPGHKVGTVTGDYHYNASQTPAQLVEIFPASVPNTGLSYEWQQSSTPTFDTYSIIGTSTSYNFTSVLNQTLYFRRKSTKSGGDYIYSNTLKLSLVSSNWEDINYIREHDVKTSGVTSWTAIDQMPIGPKIQTTTYLDGIGREMETIGKEIATPSSGSLWGDIIQFTEYDQNFARESKKYLSYSTTTESGKFKTTPVTTQGSYYSSNYSESQAYSTITYEASPLNRVSKIIEPGTSWNAIGVHGITADYELNTTADYVRIFKTNYVQGDAPITSDGFYADYTLYKTVSKDENQNQVIEFTNIEGQLILKKVEVETTHIDAYDGWICTYNVYDEFGQLRFQIQPEGVKYLAANGWSFGGTNGPTILSEQCFQHFYDDKRREIWKKAPGAKPLNMIFDSRDRVVFMQDGNQFGLSTPQWTSNLYDELDRVVITTLYNTTKSQTQLQADITNSVTINTVTVNNPSQPIIDLIIDQRNPSIPLYLARNSIEFTDGFESITNDIFETEINGSTSLPSIVTIATYKNPISQTDLNNSSVTTILKYQFYDVYSFDGVKSFNTNFTNLSAYNTSDPDVQPIVKSMRTTSLPTGAKTRILGSDVFLSSTYYYDEREQLIQILEDNVKLGTDIATLQYHFDGRVLSTSVNNSAPNTGYANFNILTKYVFDKIGRIITLQKQFGSNSLKTISTYDYDDLGRVKTKHLDPGYTANGGSELESLNYSFNLNNQITGINKDYALKTPGNYNKWSHFFGLYIGYDNKDNAFANANLTGQVTGVLWNTQGDDAQRKFDFTYDPASRLTNAIFKEQKHMGDGYSNSQMDFSITGSSGKITYDLNSNLLSMVHKGVVPGNLTPIKVDDLTYSYEDYSNKLKSVTDQMANPNVNGLFGDFKDGTNSTPDYVYDDNGNLVIDLNKNVQNLGSSSNGIKYNFLDKPELIRIVGKGTVKIVYSANGEKLQRAFIPEAGGPSRIISYINGFTYEETATITTSTAAPLGGSTATLSFIAFEEGRIRPVNAVNLLGGSDELAVDGNMDLPNNKRGAYDFFIMDYQQNVRMILTEETHHAKNKATMELGRATLEESIFGQTGSGNEVQTTRVDKPMAWTSNTIDAKVIRLGSNFGHNVGPNTLQKVMAGDKITSSVEYFYQNSPTNYDPNFISNIVGSITQAISGSNNTGNLVKNNTGAISTQLSGLPAFGSAVRPNGSNPSGTIPQAFLTILFFDERFNFIGTSDGGVYQEQVAGTIPSSGAKLGNIIGTVKAPKNGYVYIYVSNQGNEAVYFDNLDVAIDAGNIIEENHYYSYGLKIAAISSQKASENNEGSLKNEYLYNNKELFDDGDINWYDYGFRNYDPQIGRFVQLDPLTFEYPFLAPYQYASADPIDNIDIDGLEGGLSTTPEAAITLGGVVVSSGKPVAARLPDLVKPLVNPTINATQLAITAAHFGNNIINTSVQSKQVGSQKPSSTGSRPKTNTTKNQEALWPMNPKGYRNNPSPPLQGTFWFVLSATKPIEKLNLSPTPWMNTAASQYGIKEIGTTNTGPEVNNYLKSAGVPPGNAWCGAFVYWALKQNGIKGVSENPAGALNWRKYGTSLDKPVFGAIATRTRKGGGHVGFVFALDMDTPGNVIILGGNQGGRVSFSSYPIKGMQFNFPNGITPSVPLPKMRGISKNLKMD